MALITLVPLAVFPVALTFDPAIVAGHFGLAFFGRKRQNDSGRKNPVFGFGPRLGPVGS